MARFVSCSQFGQFLIDQQPVYDALIIEDVRPTEGWVAHVGSGTFEAWSGTQHVQDRMHSVFPNTTKTWKEVADGNCIGTPCDKDMHRIGFGASRLNYFLEEQSWRTDLLCFDNMMHVTRAQEHFSQIISKVLKPATTHIISNYLRKRGAQYADNKYICNKDFGSPAAAFTFNWVVVGDEEIYIDTNADPNRTFKLTPQMLQRLTDPLIRNGYMGERPYGEKFPTMLELVCGTETKWELARLGGQQGQGIGNTPSIANNWRFTEWDAASKFYKYGFSGQIGDYAIRTDAMELRFNFVGVVGSNFRYQIVLPYVNVPSSGAGGAAGLKSIANPAYDKARFCFCYVWHTNGIRILTMESESVNAEMPFARRNFSGKWQFVMHDLGADVNGCVIENMRRNKGVFIADFEQAIMPEHTEWLVLMFSKREPSCVAEIDTCNSDPGYPVQNYNSANTTCVDEHSGTSPFPLPTTLTFTPTLNGTSGFYQIAANSVLCEGGPVEGPALTGTSTVAALVVQLNTTYSAMGTFAVASGTTFTLSGPCASVSIPFQV